VTGRRLNRDYRPLVVRSQRGERRHSAEQGKIERKACHRSTVAVALPPSSSAGEYITRCDPPLDPVTDECRGKTVNFFSAFVASFGSMLLMTALIGAWLFRSSAAPLIAKVTIPALIVALACATPYQVNAMLGFPVSMSPAALPSRAELIAFVAHDDDTRVDLWLRQSNSLPRAYETTLDNKLKQTLREAQSRLGRGGRVMLVKARLRTKRTGLEERRMLDDLSYELDDSFSSLPTKN
jgi:hypothetical protein